MIKKLFNYLFWKFYEDNMAGEDFDPDESEGIFLEISMNDKFPELLKSMMRGDRIRYFRAADDKTRDMIKGEYLRTLYLFRKVKPSESKKAKVSAPKFNKIIGRYGS